MERLALVLFAATRVLLADPGTALVEKVYAKLAESFSAGEALGQTGDYLLLAHPGLTITDDFLKDPFNVATLADQVPLPARYYVTSGRMLSSTYHTILSSAELSNYLDQTLRQKALNARRHIYDKTHPGKPTPAYAAYLEREAALASARDALRLALTEKKTTGKAVNPALQAAVDKAARDFDEKGNRKLIEDAEKDLATYYNANVKALFGSLVTDMASWSNSSHGQEWFSIKCSPPAEEWLLADGWNPFTLTQSEKNLAQGRAALPLERTAGAASALPPDFLGSISVAMDTKRVNFHRPWLETGIFNGSGWRLWKSSGFSMVSTGNPADRDPGIMPLIVTGILLSRNLVLTGAWSGGSPGRVKALGPFSVESASVSSGKLTLKASGVQIIGFFCKTLPRSPNPDPTKDFRAQ
ncbi:hypothetical protein [Mesoterricola silvestris]|uniref:Uncharacterized protein n=1 Tax=Mesoterricola silvestris TaxID=2927979 RepID=A0AA48GQ27_9BACT|nr:hypothetical protein [Mesoterricola silvestris]BDU74024.1 hypothetical protein METEAL_31980 [Mesoterricola silvestris]